MNHRTNIFAAFLLLASALVAGAEDGYRLWLRYDKPADQQMLDAYSRQVTEICVPGLSPMCAAIREELELGISGLLGNSVPLVTNVARNGTVLVISCTNSPFVAGSPLQSEMSSLGLEGYLIRSINLAGREVTLIASASEAGALYGTFHFLRLMQTGHPLSGINRKTKAGAPPVESLGQLGWHGRAGVCRSIHLAMDRFAKLGFTAL
jgi:alpha-glucuronidase